MSEFRIADEALAAHFRTMEDFFQHPGWAILMEKVDEIIAARENVRNATVDTLKFVQGELAQADWLKTYPYMVATARVHNILDDNPTMTRDQEDSLWAEVEQVRARVI